MNRCIILFMALSIILMLDSCGPRDKEFNKSTWNNKYDMTYTNRENMVNDLMKNHLHKGMSYGEVIELIGQPGNYSNMEPNTIAYEIMEEYGMDIDPVEGKTLFIKFSMDSTIEKYWLDHWKH